jgi:hypothetical protein
MPAENVSRRRAGEGLGHPVDSLYAAPYKEVPSIFDFPRVCNQPSAAPPGLLACSATAND